MLSRIRRLGRAQANPTLRSAQHIILRFSRLGRARANPTLRSAQHIILNKELGFVPQPNLPIAK